LLAWIADAYPVILVVYDAGDDCAYWLSIHDYFADEQAFSKVHGKTTSVVVPTANLLNEQAMLDFGRRKAAILAPRDK
jgi:hypothetical protein